MTASESEPTGPVDDPWNGWTRPRDPRAPDSGRGPRPDPAIARPASLEDLLNSTAHGDRKAFAEIYRRLAPRVFRTVIRTVPAQAAADAIVVDVFVQVWRSAGWYDPRTGPAGSWVMSIARRRTLHHLRRAVHAAHHRADDPG